MSAPSLFDERLLPTNISIPDGFRLRPLCRDDFGYLDLLKQLTSVGFINQLQFRKRFDAMKQAKSYYIAVLEQIGSSKIVGAATLLIEYKYIHEAGQRGRVEDVVVDEAMRGKKFGVLLNEVLVEMAKTIGVYKLSLECNTELIPFYEKFGFIKNLHFLDQRFEEKTPVIWSNPKDSTLLFEESLIPSVGFQVPEGIHVRALRSNDMSYLELLKQLTSVGYVSKIDFERRFSSMTGSYFIVVLEDVTTSKVVGAATLVVEFKYIHGCGLRGRVEDVVVDEAMRGKKLGVLLNKILVEMAKNLGVYKLSLECKTTLIPFYEKFGYKENIHFMVQRFDNEVPPAVVTID